MKRNGFCFLRKVLSYDELVLPLLLLHQDRTVQRILELDQEVHPTVIVKGYRLAAEKAQVILNNIAETITIKDTDLLLQIAGTAMTGKGAESAKDKLSDLAVKAVIQVAENGEVDLDVFKYEFKKE